MLKGAIFDHDGLMFDTEKIWQKNWKELADERGIVLPEEFTHDICGTSGALMNSVIEKYYGVEDGAPIAAECVRRVHEDEAKHIDEKPGLKTILEMFRKNGVIMAVASSSPEAMIRRNLANGGVEEYFDAVVSGQSVEHGKPAPDIFLKAAEMIHLKPEECYVFEDAFNGVRAGAAAGCRTIMIPDITAPDDEMRQLAADICTTLAEASGKIEKGSL